MLHLQRKRQTYVHWRYYPNPLPSCPGLCTARPVPHAIYMYMGVGGGNGYHSGAGILGLWVLNCQKESSTVSPAQGHIITLIPEKGRAADTLLKGF